MNRPPAEFAETPKQARRFMDELYKYAYSNGKITAVDTEFVQVTHEPVLMSYSWGRGVRRVVRAELVKDHFGDWLTDPQTKIAWQNYKEDAETFEMLGIPKTELARSLYIDVMVAGVLRDETLVKHGLKAQVLHFLKWYRKEYNQLFCYIPSGKKKPIVLDPRQVMDDLPDDALTGAVIKYGNAKGGHATGERTREEWRQLMIDYAGDDGEGTQILAVDHRKFLRSIAYWQQYETIDRPFTLTLMECEDHGVLLDIPRLRVILRKQEIRIMRAEHCFRAASGNPTLNLRSGPQMQKLLIDEWGWPTREDLFSEAGNPSLNREVMLWWSQEHGFPMADVKLAFNNASTMKGTFLQGLIDGVSDDGRLRSDLNQIGAKQTGRISSRKQDTLVEVSKTLKSGVVKTSVQKKKVGANLQNIPARKEKDPDGIRGAFIAPKMGQMTAWGTFAKEDHVLAIADYSGFELCMAIHWASTFEPDSPMLKIMEKYGSPSACHAYTAIKLYADRVHKCGVSPFCCETDKKTRQLILDSAGKPVFNEHHAVGQVVVLGKIHMDDWRTVKSLFPDEYTVSKNNNFNLLYGGSPQMMARLRGLDYRNEDVLAECARQAEDWNELYWEIPIYQRGMVDHGYEHGWVPTISGRRGNVRARLEGRETRTGRIIEDEKKRKAMIGYGERCCMNIPCQGSAADIVKDAMNRIAACTVLRALGAALLFPVHDEILMECPKSTSTEVLAQMLFHMKLPFRSKFKFQIDVEGACGTDWASAKP